MMMRCLYAPFAWLLIVSSAIAAGIPPADPPAPAQTHDVATGPRLVSQPSMAPLQDAAANIEQNEVRAVLVMDVGVDGVPVNFEFVRSSGIETIDHAILDWARQTRFEPGRAGRVQRPFVFKNDDGETEDDSPSDSVPIIKTRPSLKSVAKAMASTNLRRLALTVEIAYDAHGRVTSARVLERTSSGSVEKAVVDWAKKVVVETDRPGTGLLPFAFEVK